MPVAVKTIRIYGPAKYGLREIDYLKDNAQAVAKNDMPVNTPMYFFIADDQEVSVIGWKDWKDTIASFLSEITVGQYLLLDTGHHVHYEKADIMAEEAIAFLEEIK